MGLKNFKIKFDNNTSVYNAGETIFGSIEVDLDSPKTINGISIKFLGQAHTEWTESRTTRNSEGREETTNDVYSGTETYIHNKFYVLGGPNHESVELSIGKSVYKFQLNTLPVLPSSFEGDYGHVRYTIKATIHRSWKFDHTTKEAVTIISPVDLNVNNQLRNPATLTMEKKLCSLFCNSGTLTGVVRFPCTGFVCGQVVPITLDIENGSSAKINGIVIKLVKDVTYYVTSPSRHTKKSEIKLVENKVNNPIAPNSSTVLRENLTIPSTPPSHMVNCGLIDVDYQIKIVCEIKGCHRNMHGNIPVTIGTIPLHNMVPQMINSSQPTLGWVPAVPSETTNNYQLPPPTYAESQFVAATILDKNDSEHTKINNTPYSPMYPVYNFNLPSNLPYATASAPPP